MNVHIFSFCSIAISDSFSARRGDLIRQHAKEMLQAIDAASTDGLTVRHLSTTYGDGLLFVTVVMEKPLPGPLDTTGGAK